MQEITIQGIAGCNHDVAARQFFNSRFPDIPVSPLACESFPEMFDVLNTRRDLMGIMAIENTIAGALLPNHELLRQSDLQIIGEHKMRISHALAVLPGKKIEDMESVISHPIALMQCQEFLSKFPSMKNVEYFDTAGAARDIAKGRRETTAAICPEMAADLYGLQVLERGIETNKRNFTRFLILAHPVAASKMRLPDEFINKASIVFSLQHTKGALSKVLTILSFYDMNLTKIQSMPILGKEWEYRFYIDLSFDDLTRYRQALDAVIPLMKDFKLLGEYAECTNEV